MTIEIHRHHTGGRAQHQSHRQHIGARGDGLELLEIEAGGRPVAQ